MESLIAKHSGRTLCRGAAPSRRSKRLFGQASTCAFPACDMSLVFVDRGKTTVIAEIAHIRSEWRMARAPRSASVRSVEASLGGQTGSGRGSGIGSMVGL